MVVRRAAGALAIAAGIGCLAAAGIQLAGARPAPTSFGVTETGAPTGSSTVAPVHSQPRVAPKGAVRATARVSSHLLTDPVELAIPRLHVKAAVVPVSSQGPALRVPDDAHTVGWWIASARPGAPSGSVVLDGHVDTLAQGPGALFALDDLRAGDTVAVTTGSANVRYRVVGRRVYAKSAGLPPDVFRPTRAARLVLVSCGGAFDTATHTYAENVAVFAVPV